MNPGFAVIDVASRVPTLTRVINRNGYDSYGRPTVHLHRSQDGSDRTRLRTIYRDYPRRLYGWPVEACSPRRVRCVGGVDQGLARYGYTVTDDVSPTSVKRLVAGSGKAEKVEVAASVRRILRLPEEYGFAAGYDDSDACAIILAHLIVNKLIDVEEAE